MTKHGICFGAKALLWLAFLRRQGRKNQCGSRAGRNPDSNLHMSEPRWARTSSVRHGIASTLTICARCPTAANLQTSERHSECLSGYLSFSSRDGNVRMLRSEIQTWERSLRTHEGATQNGGLRCRNNLLRNNIRRSETVGRPC